MHPSLAAMAAYRQFVIFKLVPSPTRPGKMDKLPCNLAGEVVSAHEPANWMDAATAEALALAYGAGWGVGFVFTENDPFWFLDIDNCRMGDGSPENPFTWSPLCIQLCSALQGCAMEVSQSGAGIHIFGTGRPPAHGCTNKLLGLEFYHTGRFVALTGISAQGDATVDASAVLPWLVEHYFPASAPGAAEQAWTDGPCEGWNCATDDDELIRRAMQSQSTAAAFGDRASFADLWTANEAVLSKAYPDPNGRAWDESGADAALASHLAYWTGKDCERIKRLMQRSALVRDKWERDDYLPRTILKEVGRKVDFRQDKPSALSAPLTVPTGSSDELNPEDFWAYLPGHNYVNRRTGEFLSSDAINGHLKRFTDQLGMKPALWLDMFRAAHQMSWQPAHGEIIESMIAKDGYLRPDPKGRIYNLYRPSEATATEADASLWVNHIRLLYPGDAEHIVQWCAYRIQNPGDKINHALVIGGAQGIGKDLMLEPLRYGVGTGNFADVNPGDLFKDFTGWVESTLVIINEARDLGDIDRYKFYESCKRFIAGPPDTLICNKKYIASYHVPNVMAVVITSNNKLSGLYIDPDDRRHYVAWSNTEKQSSAYFNHLWEWMHEEGGKQATLGYLRRLDVSSFDPKAPPPKTEAWHQIVAAHANPEETALADVLEGIQIATVREIIAAAQFKGHVELATQLLDRKNARKIPHLLERIGLEYLPNPYSKADGRWSLDGKRETLYVNSKLPMNERLTLATQKTLPPPKNA